MSDVSMNYAAGNARIVSIYRTAKVDDTWQNYFGLQKRIEASSIVGTLKNSAFINDNVKLVLDQDTFQTPIENSFNRPFEGYINQFTDSFFASIAQSVVSLQNLGNSNIDSTGKTINPWMKNIQAWTDTKPISVTLNFRFRLGQFGLWNAMKEVYLPILALILPALPRKINPATIEGPFPSPTSLLTKVLKSSASEIGNENYITNVFIDSIKEFVYDIAIGNTLTLTNCICTRGEYDFSTQVDTTGCPIAGTVRLTMQGVVPPALASSLVGIGSGASTIVANTPPPDNRASNYVAEQKKMLEEKAAESARIKAAEQPKLISSARDSRRLMQ